MSETTAGVHVLIWFRADDGAIDALHDGYRRMRDEQAGRAGLVRSALLSVKADPGSFLVVSEWENLRHFLAWRREPGHDDDTSPMDAFLDRTRPGGYAEIHEVVA